MIYTLHSEHKIGFKQLSSADLGLSPKSHQTHIGLFEDKNMLSFLKNTETKNAIFIYNNYSEILLCKFDRILTPEGNYRSPKIRSGRKNENTVVRKIREFAHKNPNKQYYLVWFALETEELLFWLIDNKSSDFKVITNYFPKIDTVYDQNQPTFYDVLNYIEDKIDEMTLNIDEDLEIACQTTSISDKYKPKNIEAAQKIIRDIGLKGEQLINEYLEQKKYKKLISSFEWMNKSRESAKPFDFIIHKTLNDEKFIDVKTTNYKFEQPLVFSDNEIDFIRNIDESKYSIYRVHSLKNDEIKFRECMNCLKYMEVVDKKIKTFKNNILKKNAQIKGIKIAIPPLPSVFSSFSKDIDLTGN